MRLGLIAAGVIAVAANSSAQQRVAGVDPLLVRVDDSAARRFAELYNATGGKPSAAQIQERYLANGGPAIAVFTPGRIGSAERLAGKIAANPKLYQDAVERCLPWLERRNAELRSTYLGLKGLLPDRPLPAIAVVIGANNSGGTAGNGMQVIGLEVICRLSPSEEAFADWMRQFFAHETVHTFQSGEQDDVANGLLYSALREGVPDYVTQLVTGRIPNPKRDEWARGKEEWVWQQFLADAAIVRAGTNAGGEMDEAATAAARRWFGNAGDPPEGWPDELGYWVGMRIAEAYVAASPDPRAAIDRLINPDNVAEILRVSGYASRFKPAE